MSVNKNNDPTKIPGNYEPNLVEPRWQEYWRANKTFHATDPAPGENAPAKPKYYVLDMFPYPSGSGLHIGHPEGYTASDILARYKKACGFNVLHPMGWDAFGLPAEQYAIKTGIHPSSQVRQNIITFRRQLEMLGFAIDWSREINTTDPIYYRWTQWIFLQLLKHGLAYVDEKPVWFCPALGTVLANEEVINTGDGPRSERGSHPVERRPIRQWVLRITAYAEKLLAGLDTLDWPESTKRLQTNWIGRSEGAEVDFLLASSQTVPGNAEKLTVFTTRPDTLFGATYMVIAPEHPLVPTLTTPPQRSAVASYIAAARDKSELERTSLTKDKHGVFTGSYAINPVNNVKIPIWIADYVLMGYGTGAIMAVPAHDQRDWDFAKKYDLPIIPVVNPPPNTVAKCRPAGEPPASGSETFDFNENAFEGDGLLINSGLYNELSNVEAKQRITADLASRGVGRSKVNYKLRDWLFSRQRYWGEPFPVVWISPEAYAAIPADSPQREFLPADPVSCNINGITYFALPLNAAQLPLLLPEVESYLPSETGESPLSRASDWVNVYVNLATGKFYSADALANPAKVEFPIVPALRETNTMPNWAGSCWYHLRYIDPSNKTALVAPEKAAYWATPDFYIGGAEHAVLHLLYARFWHIFLHDIGALASREPYTRLFHQGIILGEDNEKMSKSRGNVINPDTIVHDYGADALRLYLMFLGPLEAMKPWNTKNIEGVSRFLRRTWRMIVNEADGSLSPRISKTAQVSPALDRVRHQSIKKITEDIEHLRLNTAISQLMIFLNFTEKEETLPLDIVLDFLRLLAPFAPHISEELWYRVHASSGEHESITSEGWPNYDTSKLVREVVTIVFQVNGKLRGQTELPRDNLSRDTMLAAARTNEGVRKFTEGTTILKEIVVPGKLVNFVVKQ
ncbi:MAG: leucine--tRNA ligase [Puniceicoccales bacterium]|jgi:leucyl-tRNA synthetase|nr:leucine--tRNA ligase [Puniceicoccales bacterium]